MAILAELRRGRGHGVIGFTGRGADGPGGGELGAEWAQPLLQGALWARERYFIAALRLGVPNRSNVPAAVAIICQCMVGVRKDPPTVEISS